MAENKSRGWPVFVSAVIFFILVAWAAVESGALTLSALALLRTDAHGGNGVFANLTVDAEVATGANGADG